MFNNMNGNLKVTVSGTINISLKGNVVITNESERNGEKSIEKEEYKFNDLELNMSLKDTDIQVALQAMKEEVCCCKYENESEKSVEDDDEDFK